jgi:hypothetical protein
MLNRIFKYSEIEDLDFGDFVGDIVADIVRYC